MYRVLVQMPEANTDHSPGNILYLFSPVNKTEIIHRLRFYLNAPRGQISQHYAMFLLVHCQKSLWDTVPEF